MNLQKKTWTHGLTLKYVPSSVVQSWLSHVCPPHANV